MTTKDLKEYLSEDRRWLALQSTKRSGYKIKRKVKARHLLGPIPQTQGQSQPAHTPERHALHRCLDAGTATSDPVQHRNRNNARFVAPPHNATHQQLHYRIRKGNSLVCITQKFSVSVSKLRR